MHTFRYVRMIAHYLPSTSRDRSISCPHARTNQNMPPILLTMFKLFLPELEFKSWGRRVETSRGKKGILSIKELILLLKRRQLSKRLLMK